MTRKRVETEGGGSGSRRDQGIARRLACRRVQLGRMRCVIHIVCHVYCAQVTCAGWVNIFGGRVKNFMF